MVGSEDENAGKCKRAARLQCVPVPCIFPSRLEPNTSSLRRKQESFWSNFGADWCPGGGLFEMPSA